MSAQAADRQAGPARGVGRGGQIERPAGFRVGVMHNGAPMRSATRRVTYHGRTFAAFRSSPYRYPAGFHYRRFRSGEYLPPALLLSDYDIVDYGSYALGPPPPGFTWVRVGPDALLVNEDTGEVSDNAAGLFDESAPPDQEEADVGPPPPPPPPPIPVLDRSLPREFSTGAFQLGHGPTGGCVRFYNDASARADIDQSWQAQDWNGLAGKVIALGCETDLSFYLLGLSAEGLGLRQASAIYYSGALSMATKNGINPYRSCRFWKDDACRGLSIVDESQAALQRTSFSR